MEHETEAEGRPRPAAMDEANVPAPVQSGAAPGFETLLWELFLRLMDVPGDRVEAEILSAQRRLCQALDLDRSVLWQTHPDHSTRLYVTHVYDAAHDSPDAASVDGSILRGRDREFLVSDSSITKHADASDYFPWLARRLLNGETVVIAAVDELPAAAAADAASLRRFGTNSTVTVPLKAHDSILGAPVVRHDAPGPAVAGRTRREVRVGLRRSSQSRSQEERRRRQLQAALEDLKRLRDRLQHENVYLRDEIRERQNPAQIVGTSAAIRRTLDLVAQVAPTGSTVLLLGETGTGKERFAAAIHELEPAPVTPDREGELRRHPRDPHRVGALRPGEGRVHGRPDLANRAIRAGQRLDHLP